MTNKNTLHNELHNLPETDVSALAYELQNQQLGLKMQEEELHKSQAQPEEARQKYFNLYDLAPVGYFILNEKGFVTEVNMAGVSLLGTERHFLINKPLSKFMIREDIDIYSMHLRKSAETGNKEFCEIVMLKGNQPFYAQLESIAAKDTEGDNIRYFTTITDISKRVNLEKKLESLSKFPSENPNPVLRVSKEGRILYANNASSHLLNFWNCWINQMLPEPWLKMVNDAIRSSSTISYEGEIGPYVYFFTFAPIAGENYVNIYGIDITQRKRMEQELLQSKKLQAMGVMTTGIAHEFNNILAIIDGKIQMLMRENKGREKLLEELRLIRSSVKDGAEIVRRMNKFTKAREDRDWFVAIDLQEEIKSIIDYTRQRWKVAAEGAGITYTINLDDIQRVPCIKGNPLELREVLLNMVNNALDAMPEGGTLSFSTREEGGNVVLRISDTGIGMDGETQSKVFDPFFTTKDHGTGLGLSIVFGIVKRHGGKIEVQSQKGKGTAFIVSFPAEKEPTDIAVAAPEPGSKNSEKKSMEKHFLTTNDTGIRLQH